MQKEEVETEQQQQQHRKAMYIGVKSRIEAPLNLHRHALVFGIWPVLLRRFAFAAASFQPLYTIFC